MPRLNGSVALVTGASHGIGRAAAIALAREGADLALAARNESELEKTAERIRALQRKALVCATDISQPEQVNLLASSALKEFGRIDILVNNAGGWAGRGAFSETDIGEMIEMVNTDVTGTMLVTRALLPEMLRQRRGTIIGIAAVDALPGREELVAYASVKSALSAFHRALRKEVRSSAIRVGTLFLGAVASEVDGPAPSSEPPALSLTLSAVAEAVLFIACAPVQCIVEEVVMTPLSS